MHTFKASLSVAGLGCRHIFTAPEGGGPMAASRGTRGGSSPSPERRDRDQIPATGVSWPTRRAVARTPAYAPVRSESTRERPRAGMYSRSPSPVRTRRLARSRATQTIADIPAQTAVRTHPRGALPRGQQRRSSPPPRRAYSRSPSPPRRSTALGASVLCSVVRCFMLKFLVEFASRGGFEGFVRFDEAFWNHPRAVVAVLPERAAGMGEKRDGAVFSNSVRAGLRCVACGFNWIVWLAGGPL